MDLTELGAGAIFAYIIIKEVLNFLKVPKQKERDGVITQVNNKLDLVEDGVSELVSSHHRNEKDTNNQLDKVSESLVKCIELVKETHYETQKQIQETHSLLRELLIRMEK